MFTARSGQARVADGVRVDFFDEHGVSHGMLEILVIDTVA